MIAVSTRTHNRLPRWHRRLINALTATLALSGLAWLAVVYLDAPPGEATPAPHRFAGPLLEIHGIAAYAALLACALVGHAHLRTGWRIPALRRFGATLGVTILALALTGLGFYYIAAEAAVPFIRWAHVGVGVLMPLVLYVHVRSGRIAVRGTRQKGAKPPPPSHAD